MEVYKVLSSLDPNKASGIDDIPPRILRLCAEVLYTDYSIICSPFH